MKVSRLVEILSTCSPDSEVFLETIFNSWEHVLVVDGGTEDEREIKL